MIQVNFSPKIDQDKAKTIIEEIKGNPMGGWVELPLKTDAGEIQRIYETAEKIRGESEVLVCIGIGGSYLGHRAIIEALRPKSSTEVIYAGNSLSQREMAHIMEKIGDRDFSVNVISKSGTTLEPARAFETFKRRLADKYGVAEAARRIYATTDGNKGDLHDEAERYNYTRFVIPDNVGGRFSVLTAVGLLPMAVAGVKIDDLLAGARESAENTETAVKYGFMRHLLGQKGYDTEVFASFEPATAQFNEWIKQLFGETEGKNHQGIFPASVVYSTDLHSLGQFMQDGRRNLWETIINYPTDDVNAKVVQAVQTAHTQGGLPVLKLDVPTYNEKGFGELIYFFEMACAISATLYGVNPFDQPGVEAYKNELKKLLS